VDKDLCPRNNKQRHLSERGQKGLAPTRPSVENTEQTDAQGDLARGAERNRRLAAMQHFLLLIDGTAKTDSRAARFAKDAPNLTTGFPGTSSIGAE
jgi:hypothetical protein